ncbi:MAG TPA: CoA pyrophosphatase [Anaerolineaceae bacterium]|nr:CoA pyrophosphatase [Anaerolineaceae bacterium]
MYKLDVEQIKNRLSQEIPEISRQQKQNAAVQILLIENSSLDMVLTKRSVFVQNHKHEISFPGGAFERDDEDIYQTALRETCEEINLCKRSITFLGRLNPVITHYGLTIYPFLGSIAQFDFLQAQPNWEVEEIFTIPLEWFLAQENLEERAVRVADHTRKVLFYRAFQGHIVWGITAAIIYELVCELKNKAAS